MRLPKIDPKKIKVKIGNPAKPGARHSHTTLANARQYERDRIGYFFLGLFWFIDRGDTEERKMRRQRNLMCRTLQPNEITPDGSPALPVSPEYFQRMMSR